MTKFLSQQQIDCYERDGYLVIENFWSLEIVKTLRETMLNIIKSEDLSNVNSIFTTNDQTRKSDEYFLSSGREVRFFWEEKAWKDGKLILPPEVAINKVGHGLHDLIPEFENVSYDKNIALICKDLNFEKPLATQSMYIFKQAYVGGEVCPHQDGAFLFTIPQSVVGFWWALNDCTTENGCLWTVPGSHKTVPVSRLFRRKDPPDTGTEFIPPEPIQWNIEGAIPLIIPAGSLVILHGAVVHYSLENKSPIPRHAYSLHVIEGKPGFIYPEDNWLQRPQDYPFRELQL